MAYGNGSMEVNGKRREVFHAVGGTTEWPKDVKGVELLTTRPGLNLGRDVGGASEKKRNNGRRAKLRGFAEKVKGRGVGGPE